MGLSSLEPAGGNGPNDLHGAATNPSEPVRADDVVDHTPRMLHQHVLGDGSAQVGQEVLSLDSRLISFKFWALLDRRYDGGREFHAPRGCRSGGRKRGEWGFFVPNVMGYHDDVTGFEILHEGHL